MSIPLRVICAFLLVGLISGACGPAAGGPGPTTGAATPRAGGALRIGISTDVLTMDMANYRSGQDWLIGSLVFDTLITWGADGTPQPALAESWKMIDDKTYRFTLRKGVKFTDGTPFTAAAVKTQFERAAQGTFGKSYYFMIESIAADNDTTVTFKLKSPYTAFINNLANPTGGVLSPAAIAKFGDSVGRNPVGTGPFMLSDWVPGEHLTLARNPDYWGARPLLDKIELRYIADESTRMAALDAGEIDVAQNAPPQRAKDLKSSGKLQLIGGPYAQTLWLGFNHSNAILSKKGVREAIAAVIDRKALVDDVTEGITRTATGFIPPEVARADTKPLKTDPLAARQLLAQAGYPNGFAIELWVTTGRYIRDREIAQALQQPLKSIGIDASIKAMDYAAFSSGMGRHEAGLFILGWGSSSNPDTMLRAVFHSKSVANWSAYANPAVDSLIDGAVGAAAYDGALKLWGQADQLLVNDVAGVPIYWSSALFGATRRVHEFNQTPLGLFDLRTAWIE